MTNPMNQGHGHVYPRPDGARARCGGPGMCAVCSADLVRKGIQEHDAEQAPSKEMLIRQCHDISEGRTRILKQGDFAEIARLLSATPEPPVAPVAYLHEITEPDGGVNRMYSAASSNPWSHWVESHREQCSYSCTPLYGRPAQPPPPAPTDVWQCPCCNNYYIGERLVCPVSGDSRPSSTKPPEQPEATDEETPCPQRGDGIHCECWYGGNPCCGCGREDILDGRAKPPCGVSP